MRGEDRLFVQYHFTSMVTIAQYIAQLPILPLHDPIICAIEIIVQLDVNPQRDDDASPKST